MCRLISRPSVFCLRSLSMMLSMAMKSPPSVTASYVFCTNRCFNGLVVPVEHIAHCDHVGRGKRVALDIDVLRLDTALELRSLDPRFCERLHRRQIIGRARDRRVMLRDRATQKPVCAAEVGDGSVFREVEGADECHKVPALKPRHRSDKFPQGLGILVELLEKVHVPVFAPVLR